MSATGSSSPAAAVNREAKDEPPDTRGVGPVAMYATARWLRSAFSELAWEIHDAVQDDELVVVHATSPSYIVRMLLARRRMRRAVAAAETVTTS